MALLFYDGFEGLNAASANVAGITMRWANVNDSGTVLLNDLSPPSPSGYAYRPGASTTAYIERSFTASVSGIVGFRLLPFQASGAISSGVPFLALIDGSSVHLQLYFTSTNALEVRRNTTVIATSAAGTINTAAPSWVYVELKYVIDDTDGGVWIRVNGVDVLRVGAYAVSPTTLDTRDGGAAQVSIIRIRSTSAVILSRASFDDVYICDLTGSAPYNDFLGDVRVLEMLPDAAGDSAQFTPDSGNNWARVNETPGHNSDTSYVESDTGGHEDLYSTANPSSSATTVYAAKVVTVARKTAAGDRALELSLKSGSTTDRVSIGNLTDSYAEYTSTYLLNPDGTPGAWTIAALNGVQIGQRVPT